MKETGNNNISKAEMQFAALIKELNLDHANKISGPVFPKDSVYSRYIKRALDIGVVVPVLLIMSPVLLLLAVMNLFTMGKPILYKQIRVGYKGKPFEMLKFRSMKNIIGKDGKLLPASQRLTKYGRFIRKFSLDELPNLLNILRGDMSIIGPRALPVEFEERYSERHKQRCMVRPGLECPSIHKKQSVRLYQEQFENDIWYVEHVSFLVDIKMALALVRLVFDAKERSDHAVVGGGNFVGYDENGIAFSMRRIPEKYEQVYQRLLEQETVEAV